MPDDFPCCSASVLMEACSRIDRPVWLHVDNGKITTRPKDGLETLEFAILTTLDGVAVPIL